MSNTNTEVLTTAYEKLQGAITQSNTVLPKLEEAVEKGNLDNYATVSQLEENMNKIAETKNMLGIETCKGKVRHIFCEGDSLTHGTNKSYVDFLRDSLRSQIGDGGSGLVMFDNTMISREGVSLGYSSGLTLLHSLASNAVPRIYSICGQGLYTDSGDGSDYITFNVNRKYDKMKVFYLKQPSGGTFKIGFTNVNVSSHTTIDTSGNLGLDYVEITADASKGSGIKISSITGKVCIFGAFSYIENDGVTISRLAYGGDRLEYHHNTDSTFRQKWVELLQPSNYFICLGMNDRTDITQENFKTWMSDIVSDIQTGCTDTNITLIRSSDSGDTETTALKYYATLLKEIAEEKRVGYLDFRNILGDYENMVKNNWITSDKIHLTENGYSTEASYISQYLGFNSNYVYKAVTPFGTAESTYNYNNNLTTKAITIDSAGSSVIYKLGIANAYSIALLKLDITGSKHGTAHICKKECYISLANGTVVNQVTSIGELTSVTKYTTGTNPIPDFTVSASINNNLLEITLANNSGSYKMDFCISGQITFSYLTVKGTSVYEN